MKFSPIYIFLAVLALNPLSVAYAQSNLLSSEENIWLASRNNTISVIPEKNNPPFSFNDSSYISQGIFIDYIELAAEKLGIKVEYLSARTRSDIITAMNENKADYVSTLEIDKAQELSLPVNSPYATFPAIIAVRKDYNSREGMTLDDFNNRSVAVIQDSAISSYVKKNYPRVIVQEVVDNELALQKVALNEVDATVINSASLAYLLSKQSMRSIKVVGSLTFDLKMAFTVQKGKDILNSILGKGLQQISPKEHQAILDKWISLPNEKDKTNSFLSGINSNTGVIVIVVFFVGVIILIIKKKKVPFYHYSRKADKVNELEQDIMELESTSAGLIEELKNVKTLEQDIKEKLQNIEK